MKRTAPEICPACGAEVPPRALACPECGADEKTGWNEEATQYDGLDLPGEFSDQKEVANNRSKSSPRRTRINGVPWYWWLLAVILLAMFTYAMLVGRW